MPGEEKPERALRLSETRPELMASKRLSSASKREVVYQFRISLFGISPEIWRRIVVPERYSFWDLHVAVQDAMGWLDYHLHLFEVSEVGSKARIKIGIPDEDFEDDVAAGWEIGISEYFTRPGQVATYDYDFGDGWHHQVLMEGILLGDVQGRYPVCVAGERACPPEDCGGVPGYEQLLEILAKPKHKEHKEMIQWLKGHAKNYHPFNPGEFIPSRVRFSNPKLRWKQAFEDED